MTNLLYQAIRIKRSRDVFRFLRSISLPLAVEKTMLAGNQSEIFLYGEGKRASLSRAGRVETYANPPGKLRHLTYHNGLQAAIEDDKILLMHNNSFCQLSSDGLSGDIRNASLQLCQGTLVLYSHDSGDLFSHPIKSHDPFDRSDASWRLDRKNTVFFLPGDEGALFLQHLAGEYVPALSFLDSRARIQQTLGFLSEKTLHVKGEREGEVYLVQGNSLQSLCFPGGVHKELASLVEAPRRLAASGKYIALLYSDHLEIRDQEQVLFVKEHVEHFDDLVFLSDKLLLFSAPERKVNIYQFQP